MTNDATGFSACEHIPNELKRQRLFLVWRLTPPNPPEKKPRKVPFYVNGKPREGAQGDAQDMAHLATYDEAVAAGRKGRYNGLGIAVVPGCGLVALDFDNVVADGVIQSEVLELCEGTYTEYSPSGTGIRAFFTGELPSRKDSKGEKGAYGLEVFGNSGFVTITGKVIPDCALFGNDAHVAPLTEAVRKEYAKRWPHSATGSAMVPQSADDAWLLALGSRLGWTLGDAAALLANCNPSCDRDHWLKAGMALHHEFDGSDEAFELYDAWSSKGENYAGTKDVQGRWRSFGRNAGAGNQITGVWLLSWRKECVAKSGERGAQLQQPGQLEAQRREFQKAENQRIGEGTDAVPVAQNLTLESALQRFVFLSDGSRVADIFNLHYDLGYQDWAATFAASRALVPQPDRELKDGTKKPQAAKEVPVSELWRSSPHRKTAVCRTFKADGSLILPDPEGRRALNTWRPFDRSLQPGDTIGVFLNHVALLFPIESDKERFLDWLSHVEQHPGELPHTAWLHIARNFGLGRNWLASVLARVWAGNVAANCDLVQLLRTGFNGHLSRKVLAVVDEIREGGRDSQWEHAEKMKSLITEEQRVINPKYGRQSIEFNACRWLMFSNHLSAIPMERGDRRIEVVVTEAAPLAPDYYARLYQALKDPAFISAVAHYLGQRDISRFNPGAHAAITEAKLAATKASQSPMAAWCQMLVEYWPADLITAADLFSVLEGDRAEGELSPAHRRTLETIGIEPYSKPIKLNGRLRRVSILRNKSKWRQAEPADIRTELHKASFEGINCRDFLMEQTADAEDHDEPECIRLF